MTLVLIVDDEVQLTLSVARLLRRRGHDVRTATSGAEALGMLDGVDLLLTDMRMPGMNGLELIAEVKRRRPGVRCCLMSGAFGSEGTAAAEALVDAHLSKPFSHDDLLALVQGDDKATRDPGAR